MSKTMWVNKFPVAMAELWDAKAPLPDDAGIVSDLRPSRIPCHPFVDIDMDILDMDYSFFEAHHPN